MACHRILAPSAQIVKHYATLLSLTGCWRTTLTQIFIHAEEVLDHGVDEDEHHREADTKSQLEHGRTEVALVEQNTVSRVVRASGVGANEEVMRILEEDRTLDRIGDIFITNGSVEGHPSALPRIFGISIATPNLISIKIIRIPIIRTFRT